MLSIKVMNIRVKPLMRPPRRGSQVKSNMCATFSGCKQLVCSPCCNWWVHSRGFRMSLHNRLCCVMQLDHLWWSPRWTICQLHPSPFVRKLHPLQHHIHIADMTWHDMNWNAIFLRKHETFRGLAQKVPSFKHFNSCNATIRPWEDLSASWRDLPPVSLATLPLTWPIATTQSLPSSPNTGSTTIDGSVVFVVGCKLDQSGTRHCCQKLCNRPVGGKSQAHFVFHCDLVILEQENVPTRANLTYTELSIWDKEVASSHLAKTRLNWKTSKSFRRIANSALLVAYSALYLFLLQEFLNFVDSLRERSFAKSNDVPKDPDVRDRTHICLHYQKARSWWNSSPNHVSCHCTILICVWQCLLYQQWKRVGIHVQIMRYLLDMANVWANSGWRCVQFASAAKPIKFGRWINGHNKFKH